MFRRVLWLILCTVLFGLFLARETRSGLFEKIDGAFLDWMNAQSRQPAPVVDLTLVEIDEQSLETTGAWPWEPLEYALFLDAMSRFDPAVTTIEPILSWETSQPEYERILESKILALPKVLLGAELGAGADSEAKSASPLPVLRDVRGDKSRLPDFPEVLREPDERLGSGTTRGFVNLPDVNAGDSTRVVPLLFRCRGEVVPSLVLQAAMLWLKLTPAELTVTLNSHIRMGPYFRIPIDSQGRMRLNLRALEGINRISYDDLLLDAELKRIGTSTEQQAALESGRLVFLGRTDPESRTLFLGDGRAVSPLMIFAGGAATIQSRAFLSMPSNQVLAGVLGGILVFAVLLAVLRRGAVLWIFAAFIPLYGLTSVTLFEKTGIALPLVMPAALFVALVLFRFALPTRESAKHKN